MTVIVPEKYHAIEALENRKIHCITEYAAQHKDIRPLRIGILNIMPKAKEYEFSLLFPLGRSIIQIEPVWIRLETHDYKSTSHDYLDELYVTFDDAIKERHLDGLIITGAPVENIPFESVKYWSEFNRIIEYAKRNITSTVGICWGGLALAKIMGIEKCTYREKLFGVFETRNLDRKHEITGELNDVFWLPHSRYAGIEDSLLEEARDKGLVNLLAYSDDTGYSIFESSDKKFLINLGHPEYQTERLVEEYLRDKKKGLTDVVRPKNLDINRPLNRWRVSGLEFFKQWLKYVYETTPF